MTGALFFQVSPGVQAARKLFTVLGNFNETIPACNDSSIVTCQLIRVDFDVFRRRKLEFPGGKVLQKGRSIATGVAGLRSTEYSVSSTQMFL